jgi:malate dehydrogenase (oxaloacetate-decarboxylating)
VGHDSAHGPFFFFMRPCPRRPVCWPDMSRVSRYYDVKRDQNGERYLEVYLTGFGLLRLPLLNKSTSYTTEERRLLDLDGLVPPHYSTLEEQKERTYRRYSLQGSALERHVYLRNLQDRNEVLFFALLEDHLEEMMPILYTPTVGEAVKQFSEIYSYPRGLTISLGTLERIEQTFHNVPLDDVRMIVATDSSAILGIGDQGFGGMAISIGKLSLYTVAGGVGPDKTLPVELDVGTDREDLLSDPLYLGTHHKRLTGKPYFDFLDHFVETVSSRYPKAIIQWEDFARGTAFEVLDRYRKVVPSFNDDIQGTGAMALAGVMNACKLSQVAFNEQRIVVVGAGAGGIGVSWALRQGLVRAGLTPDQAKAQVLVVDRQGLLLSDQVVEPHQASYCQDQAMTKDWPIVGAIPTLLETVQYSKATVLLGLSGVNGLFSQAVVEAMAANSAQPMIFPLSNPTANAEALPDDIIRWSDGRAIIATGSPFAPVFYRGREYTIGQGNNAFIFPGLGFGAVLCRAREISDGMVLEAAQALADETPAGRVYPAIANLREVSIRVAARVMAQAIREGVAAEFRLRGLDLAALEAYARSRFWYPRYLPFRKGV